MRFPIFVIWTSFLKYEYVYSNAPFFEPRFRGLRVAVAQRGPRGAEVRLLQRVPRRRRRLQRTCSETFLETLV